MAKKIIIAVDEWELRKLLRLILEEYDFEVTESESEAQTIEYAYSEKPDLLMLDHNLAGDNSGEILGKLSHETGTSNIPIIILTGKGSVAGTFAETNGQIKGFIEKPFDEAKIKRALENVFGEIQKNTGLPGEVPAVNAPEEIHEPEIPAEPVPESAISPKDEISSTKYYNLGNVSLKKVIAVLCGADLPDEPVSFPGKSLLLIVYSGFADSNLMEKIVDVFGNSMPVLIVDSKSFKDKREKLASLGLKMFEIEPEAFRRV